MAKQKLRRSNLVTLVTLTPDHPDWNKFIDRLAGPGGCNFRKTKTKGWKWGCKGGRERLIARKVLKNMNKLGILPYEINIDATILMCDKFGGWCDCEIVLNNPKAEEDDKTGT
jgi:hypothetical protein